MKLGIDIGSTTIKLTVLTDENELIYKHYERHQSKIKEKLSRCLLEVKKALPLYKEFDIAITGSGGMGIAKDLGIGFVQEVFATKVATDTVLNGIDVVIELGGEDAKILFLSDGQEVRMNGTCAGGTGAFIDQIGTLLGISPNEMNELSKESTKIYPIASRCGVFAKSDIQPLLNQGAKKTDLSASIFYAVVNQTVSGLARGREIKGKVAYLGGPLTFLSSLRDSFDSTLNLKGICPNNSLYFVAMGSALCADTKVDIGEFINRVNEYKPQQNFDITSSLFGDEEEYKEFKARHDKHSVKENNIKDYDGKVFIGIDAGSTTIKTVVIDENEEILFYRYKSNQGNPIPHIKGFLEEFYSLHPKAKVISGAVTGYGEDMIKSAFGIDYGLVETLAHCTAAKKFNKDVDFIIDIGGQDMKCFKIRDGIIDDIFLNEACSSGCGSFLQSFAQVLGYETKDFAKLALFANAPVDLGSRCTVFMNSSVKQAQKDGASVDNISAGLSISVVKNAIYKVIRQSDASSLGKNIVVQGGTFLNDGVLRAFEKEIGGEVIRPNIAGIMGAYGCALFAKSKGEKSTTIMNVEALKNFSHKTNYTHCNYCTNHCSLTINIFDGKRKYIAGNRCDKPLGGIVKEENQLNLYEYKRQLLSQYMDKKVEGASKGTVGMPMVLNMYELLPFWSKFFETLGINLVTSGLYKYDQYLNGKNSIPSYTIFFTAKLIHGHIEELVTKDIDLLFYPCMTYNVNEGRGDNHYNCPVVAYYPEAVANNMDAVENVKYNYDYVGIHRPLDFSKKMKKILSEYFNGISLSQVEKASKLAYEEREAFLTKVREKAAYIINQSRQKGKSIIVLAGRPYHLDAKVNHGLDKLISTFGVGIVTEDSISHLNDESCELGVLNQWTYHARLYDSAKYVSTQDDMHLIQLVSFGCGVDALTTDEVRNILNKENRIYTQIKIDEITNLGAAKIRIRSLLGAIEQEES